MKQAGLDLLCSSYIYIVPPSLFSRILVREWVSSIYQDDRIGSVIETSRGGWLKVFIYLLFKGRASNFLHRYDTFSLHFLLTNGTKCCINATPSTNNPGGQIRTPFSSWYVNERQEKVLTDLNRGSHLYGFTTPHFIFLKQRSQRACLTDVTN